MTSRAGIMELIIKVSSILIINPFKTRNSLLGHANNVDPVQMLQKVASRSGSTLCA